MSKSLKILLTLLVVIVFMSVMGKLMFNYAGNYAKGYTGDFYPVSHELNDGIYRGTYTVIMGLCRANITFVIRHQKLDTFMGEKITHTPGYAISDSIISRINNKKDLNFDVISGATCSCYLAKAAIKNAIVEFPKNK